MELKVQKVLLRPKLKNIWISHVKYSKNPTLKLLLVDLHVKCQAKNVLLAKKALWMFRQEKMA